MDDNKFRRGIRALISLIKLLLQLGFGFSKASNFQTLDLYRRADLILEKGGGSYFSSSRYYFYLGLYQQLFNLWMGKFFGKHVLVAPQSIGPFNKKFDELFVAKVLRAMDVVMVREPISKSILEALNVSCVIVPDTAFLYSYQGFRQNYGDQYLGLFNNACLNIGVTVLDWRWAVSEACCSPCAISEYLDKIAYALGTIHQKQHLRVIILPQVTVGLCDNDTGVSQALATRLKGKVAEVIIIDRELTVSDCCGLYNSMDLVIGSRMHSSILAMMQGVPTVGLSYQPKTRGVFSMLGLDDFVLDIVTFSGEELLYSLNNILENLKEHRILFRDAADSAGQEVKHQFDILIKPLLAGLLSKHNY